MKLKTLLFGKTYAFRDVKDVLAKANEPKSGDRLAGLAAESAQERVAAKAVLAELLLPFVKVGGKAVCYKGPAASEEWDAGQRAARLLGGGKLERTPIVLPGQEDWEHCVIALPKKEKTVRQYPRKAGMPGRDPLGQTGGK